MDVKALQKSLYSRIGGRVQIEVLVIAIYDYMKADSDFVQFFIKFPNLQRLKERTIAYFVGVWGGPEPYVGLDMFYAHAGIDVTEHAYDRMVYYYKKQVRIMELPEDVCEEIIERVEELRIPCCDPGKVMEQVFLKKWEQNTQNRLAKTKKEKGKKQEREQGGHQLANDDDKEKAKKQDREQGGRQLAHDKGKAKKQERKQEGHQLANDDASNNGELSLSSSKFDFEPLVDDLPEKHGVPPCACEVRLLFWQGTCESDDVQYQRLIRI